MSARALGSILAILLVAVVTLGCTQPGPATIAAAETAIAAATINAAATDGGSPTAESTATPEETPTAEEAPTAGETSTAGETPTAEEAPPSDATATTAAVATATGATVAAPEAAADGDGAPGIGGAEPEPTAIPEVVVTPPREGTVADAPPAAAPSPSPPPEVFVDPEELVEVPPPTPQPLPGDGAPWVWDADLGQSRAVSIAADGTVHSISDDGMLVALAPDGTTLGTTALPQRRVDALALAQEDRDLRALSLPDGTLIFFRGTAPGEEVRMSVLQTDGSAALYGPNELRNWNQPACNLAWPFQPRGAFVEGDLLLFWIFCSEGVPVDPIADRWVLDLYAYTGSGAPQQRYVQAHEADEPVPRTLANGRHGILTYDAADQTLSWLTRQRAEIFTIPAAVGTGDVVGIELLDLDWRGVAHLVVVTREAGGNIVRNAMALSSDGSYRPLDDYLEQAAADSPRACLYRQSMAPDLDAEVAPDAPFYFPDATTTFLVTTNRVNRSLSLITCRTNGPGQRVDYAWPADEPLPEPEQLIIGHDGRVYVQQCVGEPCAHRLRKLDVGFAMGQ